jgi:hypothetical protein
MGHKRGMKEDVVPSRKNVKCLRKQSMNNNKKEGKDRQWAQGTRKERVSGKQRTKGWTKRTVRKRKGEKKNKKNRENKKTMHFYKTLMMYGFYLALLFNHTDAAT